MKNGILCMYKPQGFTSFDVVAKLRGILKVRRLGHSGTLDPMATGVLPVFVGTATKCCDVLPNGDKSYVAGFRLGYSTDTQDSTGSVLKEYPHRDVTADGIESVLKGYVGEVEQLPPMYSAVQVNGRRLYELARQNVVVERPTRTVTVYGIDLLSYDSASQTGELSIECGKGTYVRTIIHDLGEALGVGGHMVSLVRTAASGFTLEECHTFEEVERAVLAETVDDLIVPTERVFEGLPRVRLTEPQTQAYRNGVKLPLEGLDVESGTEACTVYAHDGAFIGTARPDPEGGVLRVWKNF